ncbi:hypothetical protein ACQJBY_054834 [Aegilops geniculata]
MATPPAASSSSPSPSLPLPREGREWKGSGGKGGSAQIRSRTGGPPSLEIVHGGPTRLQPWTETPETLATRGGPTPQPPRKGRAPAAGHLRRPPTMVARIWTSCCSYCFRWTRTSPPSWLLRLPTPSSYPLAWCGKRCRREEESLSQALSRRCTGNLETVKEVSNDEYIQILRHVLKRVSADILDHTKILRRDVPDLFF